MSEQVLLHSENLDPGPPSNSRNAALLSPALLRTGHAVMISENSPYSSKEAPSVILTSFLYCNLTHNFYREGSFLVGQPLGGDAITCPNVSFRIGAK